MFITGRVDRQKNLKQAREEISKIINECGEETLQQLIDGNCLQFIRKYKILKTNVNNIQASYNVLLSSSLASTVPNITVQQNIINDTNLSSSSDHSVGESAIEDAIANLNWDTIRTIVFDKCDLEIRRRNAKYDAEVQKIVKSELYPVMMKYDPLSSLKEDINIEQPYALLMATNYIKVCHQYMKAAKEIVGDKNILQKKIGDHLSLYLYPIVNPCKWCLDFCNTVELPDYVNEEEHAIQYIDNDVGFLENKLYISVVGVEAIDLSSMKRRKNSKSIHKMFALDLPYHMTRFLSIFGGVIFTPYKLDSTQFPKIERFTDTQLLLHFALKYDNEDLYEEFIQDELAFYKKHEYHIPKVLNKAIQLLIQSDQKEGTIFDVNKEGDIKIYMYEQTIENPNVPRPSGVEIPIKRRLLEVPHEIMKVLRTFILPDINEFRKERGIALVIGKFKELQIKYAQWILSPIGKLLNFDTQAHVDFAHLDNDLCNKIPIHRYLNPKISFAPCITNIYTLLLQTAYALREICDPIDFKDIKSSFLIHDIIIKGETRGYSNMISYMPVFEAFPGLFYFSFLFKALESQAFPNKTILQAKGKETTDIFRLFESYVNFIPKIIQKNTTISNVYLAECLKPDDIRWIKAEKILFIMGTYKKEIRKIRCRFLNTNRKKLDQTINQDNDTWKYFAHPIGPKHVFKSDLEIEKSYFSTSMKNALQAFYKTPITMGMEIKTLEKSTAKSST
jgi:hypothetical protein